jgi:SNF2 family DNA or RNA helicase
MEIYYSIFSTNDLKFAFEVVCFSGIKKGNRVQKDPIHRAFSVETIKVSINPLEQNLFSLLVKEKRLSQDFSRFAISKENAKKVLKALALTCRLIEKEQFATISFDVKAEIDICQVGQQLKLQIDREVVPSKQAFSIPEIVVVKADQFFQYSKEVSKRLLLELDKDLQQSEILELEEEYQDEIKFQLSKECKLEESSTPIPLLKLTDRTGAFANLGFYYGKELIFHHEMKNRNKRNLQEEKLWEEDLIKAGFIKKIVAGSNYYCGMDKVAKALSTLVDCGWDVIDTYDRKVVKGNTNHLEFSLQQDRVHLSGKIDFLEKKVDLKDVYGAFCRRQTFLDLGNNQVGLIDPTVFKDQQEIGIEIEEEGTGISFHKAGFSLMNAAFGGLKTQFSIDDKFNEAPLEISEGNSSFQGILYPYQKAGVEWLLSLYQRKLSGLLADDMGLGKTVQIIAFLAHIKFSKVLIVVPTSLLFHWKKEIEKFSPSFSIRVFHGKDKFSQIDEQEMVCLTSYGMIREHTNHFYKEKFDVVILDEAQAIKNRESQIFAAIKNLHSTFRVSITGTPIENNLQELYTHFDFLMPGLLNQELVYGADQDIFAKKRIKKVIEPYFLRRKKNEVLKELPEKIEQTVFVEMDEEESSSYENTLKLLHQNKDFHVLEAILRLRQHCVLPRIVNPEFVGAGAKFQRVLDDLIEISQNDEKVILYSSFIPVLQQFKSKLEEIHVFPLYLDGSTVDRQKLVDAFQNEKDKKIFLISLKAGGVGLNLHAADYVLIYDPWWNEAAENQAIDRAHRIGREKTVIARKYILHESIEEKILKLKESKSKLYQELIENNFNNELISQIF